MIPLKQEEGSDIKESDPSEFEGVILRDYWDWVTSANCRALNPEIYERKEKIPFAKFICQGCPVIRDCLMYSLIYNEYGIWGGTTKNERNKKYSKHDRDVLIRQARLQGLYYRRFSPGALIRQFQEQMEE